jgi:hypothetical protein
VNRYIRDADYTAQSLYEDIKSRLDAHSYVSPEDVEAYERAEALFKQQKSLWQDDEGFLTDHDHVFGMAS